MSILIKDTHDYCSICTALLPDHTIYCSRFGLIKKIEKIKMNNELIQSIKEYKENINTGKVTQYTTDENWKCVGCGNKFTYRPFTCAVICNDCLLLKDQRIEMDNKAPHNYCSICSALLPNHTSYCSRFNLIATNATDRVTMFHRCMKCGQEWYSDIINAEKHPCFKKD